MSHDWGVVESKNAQPGDIVFCHTTNKFGRLIRLAERIHFRRGSDWNHVAILLSPVGNDWLVIQAESMGVTDFRLLSDIAPGGTFQIIALPDSIDATSVLDFAEQEVGARYGWASICSIAVNLLTPNWLDVRRPSTWICSALVAEALRVGDWLHRWPSIYLVTPSQLWEAIT